MAKISRQVGTTNEILNIFIRDATNVSSAGLANVSSTSVSFAWMRSDQNGVSSGTATAGGTLGTYSVSTLTQMSSSLALGWYQFSPPNAVFLSGTSAILHLYGYPNMAPTPIEIELTKTDNQSYVSTVKVLGTVNPVGVSTVTIPVGVSSGVVGVSSATIPFGVSSLTAGVNVSSINGVTVIGAGTSGDLWRA